MELSLSNQQDLSYQIAWPVGRSEHDVASIRLHADSSGKLKIVYRFVNEASEHNVDAEMSCVWWSFAEAQWSSDGCTASQKVVAMVDDSNSEIATGKAVVEVHSSHLTNFAIIVTRRSSSSGGSDSETDSGASSSYSSDEKALSFISIIGGAVCCACLLACAAVLLFIWNHDSVQTYHKYLVQLCFALIGYVCSFFILLEQCVNN
jgi:hypothetical protein